MNTETLKAILGTVRIDKDGKELQEPICHGIGDEQYYGSRMDEYQEATEVIKLVPLSEFVNVFKKESQVNCCEMAGKVINYTDFITQQLTKGQFVPCWKDGSVINTNVTFEDSEKGSLDGANYYEQFQQAQDRVLFDRVIFETYKAKFDMNAGHVNESTLIELLKFGGTIEQALNNGVILYLKIRG